VHLTVGWPIRDARKSLERLKSSYAGLDLRSGRKAQFYHLVCDKAFVLVSNRPFLSVAGKVRTFHHVVGYLLQRGDLIQAYATRLGPLAAYPAPAARRKLVGRK
jgi:hypothetical protein